MCFTQGMSAAFSVMGLLFTGWLWRTNGNRSLIQGVLYFVLMELLQVAQYSFIATDITAAAPTLAEFMASPVCQSPTNQFLTFLGIVHIAFQPYHSAILFGAFYTSDKNVAQMKLVGRLQLLGGCMLVARNLFTLVDASTFEQFGIDQRYLFDPTKWDATDVEWLTGPVLCTYQGLTHLAWSIPFMPVSYYMPSMALHSFLMFVPFFLVDTGSTMANFTNCIAGLILFVTGPILADSIAPNKHEAASIWCFFSIMQIVVLVMLLAGQRISRGRWYVNEKQD